MKKIKLLPVIRVRAKKIKYELSAVNHKLADTIVVAACKLWLHI